MEPNGESLKGLIELARSAGLEEAVWEKGGHRISLRRQAASPEAPVLEMLPGPAQEPESPKSHIVPSPMVGTFWRSPAKDRPPFVLEGEEVESGERLALVEAMKVPKDVISSVSGRITKIFVENGKPVEYGQKLFEVELK